MTDPSPSEPLIEQTIARYTREVMVRANEDIDYPRMRQLVENASGGVAGIVELQFPNGRERLAPYTVTSLISFSYKD